MDISQKLTKKITEAKYLVEENSWRYRVIIRYFFTQYEKIKYWLYKEDIFEELKKHELFADYTMEQCKQDLDVLIKWGNLVAVQDSSKVATVEEFKNKQYRYELSEYSVEIERMTIKLENLFVEGASLEPSLLERLLEELAKFREMLTQDDRTVAVWWKNLNDDFKRLNQNYQDYIRDWYGVKAEEIMKTNQFLIYKDKLVEYFRDFVKALQRYSYMIENVITDISQDHEKIVLKKVYEHESSIVRVEEIDEKALYDNINGKWMNMKEWFLGSETRDSEAAKLFEMTNEIIRKITRYAAQIAESVNSSANRKEEYKKICNMFLECSRIEDAHKLSSYVFGIPHMKHIKGGTMRETDSINSGIFDEKPYEVKIKPRVRTYREKSQRKPIREYREEKEQLIQSIIKKREEEGKILKSYIKDGKLEFENLPIIKPHVRNTLLRWLSKAMQSSANMAKTEDGEVFRIIYPSSSERCTLECEDGIFEMPAYVLEFDTESGWYYGRDEVTA